MKKTVIMFSIAGILLLSCNNKEKQPDLDKKNSPVKSIKTSNLIQKESLPQRKEDSLNKVIDSFQNIYGGYRDYNYEPAFKVKDTFLIDYE